MDLTHSGPDEVSVCVAAAETHPWTHQSDIHTHTLSHTHAHTHTQWYWQRASLLLSSAQIICKDAAPTTGNHPPARRCSGSALCVNNCQRESNCCVAASSLCFNRLQHLLCSSVFTRPPCICKLNLFLFFTRHRWQVFLLLFLTPGMDVRWDQQLRPLDKLLYCQWRIPLWPSINWRSDPGLSLCFLPLRQL